MQICLKPCVCFMCFVYMVCDHMLHVREYGLSLKTQDLTALFLAVRLYCSFVMEYDIHTVLDTATLVATLFVIYMIRFKLRSTYMVDKDNFALYYVVIPCAVLALVVHPSTSHNIANRFSWAFCVYLEAVSVLPQLRLMQNTKIVEPFTAHYVFALGVARFLSCAHWVLQIAYHMRHVGHHHSLDMFRHSCLPCKKCNLYGSGHPWASVDCAGLRAVAIHGSPVRNRADLHPRRFLLLLCEEPGRRAAGATATLRGGVGGYLQREKRLVGSHPSEEDIFSYSLQVSLVRKLQQQT
uniref:Putative ER lumen protein retaining receptor n=1 Tax=Aegilops tauschii TaxID=37682 RepID=M8BK70_AEGTA